eukprot:CAMPEP_0201905874 /NCGR_PEP_ID=MMETSP0902-20130614/56735_1 /ASSEMBLY_ACC=CAM_ASM_000551 /TAXON_ID=420261 /ORGANISM="Thalassiosira antarctica, Strain CCMP982" /LENGTH=63 /DNA_ID=CAMNT_0048439997 /DNA_START=1058 /DNA_END=1249 /DNA_ORIENTATION=+
MSDDSTIIFMKAVKMRQRWQQRQRQSSKEATLAAKKRYGADAILDMASALVVRHIVMNGHGYN